jgi:hypothetical protein
MSIGKTIKSYVWWTHPRGNLHYDVMVTLILAFIFLAPRWVDFKDKPPGRPAHPTAVLVQPDGEHGFIYQLDASAIDATDDRGIRQELKRVIEPVSGSIVFDHYLKERNDSGHEVYRVWVHR